ncbi:MAG: hypothetical protein LBV67_00390 [Streptococcaceae bacterium]|jgi:DNA-binding HxlR family transcriptional regulator|nr:hypothetical protein [Streptococcaceae bacterium]
MKQKKKFIQTMAVFVGLLVILAGCSARLGKSDYQATLETLDTFIQEYEQGGKVLRKGAALALSGSEGVEEFLEDLSTLRGGLANNIQTLGEEKVVQKDKQAREYYQKVKEYYQLMEEELDIFESLIVFQIPIFAKYQQLTKAANSSDTYELLNALRDITSEIDTDVVQDERFKEKTIAFKEALVALTQTLEELHNDEKVDFKVMNQNVKKVETSAQAMVDQMEEMLKSTAEDGLVDTLEELYNYVNKKAG